MRITKTRQWTWHRWPQRWADTGLPPACRSATPPCWVPRWTAVPQWGRKWDATNHGSPSLPHFFHFTLFFMLCVPHAFLLSTPKIYSVMATDGGRCQRYLGWDIRDSWRELPRIAGEERSNLCLQSCDGGHAGDSCR